MKHYCTNLALVVSLRCVYLVSIVTKGAVSISFAETRVLIMEDMLVFLQEKDQKYSLLSLDQKVNRVCFCMHRSHDLMDNFLQLAGIINTTGTNAITRIVGMPA